MRLKGSYNFWRKEAAKRIKSPFTEAKDIKRKGYKKKRKERENRDTLGNYTGIW